ncbi:hypothetical protein WA577_005820 [Blastocystis sp. JDR]
MALMQFENNWIPLSEYLSDLEIDADKKEEQLSEKAMLLVSKVRVLPIKEKEFKLTNPENWIDVLASRSLVDGVEMACSIEGASPDHHQHDADPEEVERANKRAQRVLLR